jgi:putative transposase
MARPLRLEFPGALYHITSRGNAQQSIFFDDEDYHSFLQVLSIVVERFDWLSHAYCLMGNHYHLLIETPKGNLSRGMRQLNGHYTQIFNRRHQRVGHIFQGRYKAILVEKDRHLLSLCRYLVLNPVRAGLVKKPQRWRWSSYRATAGEEKRPSFLTVEWILSQFDRRKGKAVRKYRAFVIEGSKDDSPWKDLKGQILLGTGEFVCELRDLLKRKEKVEEVPRVQRLAARPSLGEIFRKEEQGHGARRDEVIYAAYVRYGYTLKEMAEHLGVHYATISRAIKRVEQRNP